MENAQGRGGRFRVLTMDGGPSPLLQIRLLREVERLCPGFLERTDLFAGTSDGGFISLFLAASLTRGKSAAQALDDAVTFGNELIYALDLDWCSVARLLLGFSAAHSARGLRALLEKKDVYGDLRMTELTRGAMVVSFDAFNWRPRYFRNFEPFCHRGADDTSGATLVDAALSSSAFPLFLPIHYGFRGRHYLDGGLVANNPAMCALVSAAEHLRKRQHATDDNVRRWLGDLCILSLGATESPAERHDTNRPAPIMDGPDVAPPPAGCPRPDPVSAWPPRDLNWGWWEWFMLRPLALVNTMLHAPTMAIADQCTELLGDQHHRYGPVIGEIATALRLELAPPRRAIDALDQQAKKILDGNDVENRRFGDTVQWIKKNWMLDASTTT